MTDDHKPESTDNSNDGPETGKAWKETPARTYEEAADDLVRAGRFESREDVLREGVRLVEWRERRRAELDAALARGLAEADAGLGTPLDEVAARLKAKYRAMAGDRPQASAVDRSKRQPSGQADGQAKEQAIDQAID